MKTLKPRGILVAGNWKMNHAPKATGTFFLELSKLGPDLLSPEKLSLLQNGRLKACLFPPFVSLSAARLCLPQIPFPLEIGAQNAHWELKGAFTGEISGPMLTEEGINWVLVGHSERRQYFGETNESVRKRAASLLKQGFHVILCIGETLAQRQASQTESVLELQVQEALFHTESRLDPYLNGQLILAYEPIWAIGTGQTATSDQIENSHLFIRQLLQRLSSKEAAERTPILYGGSVTPENIESILLQPNVDGALVGGASVNSRSYLSLLQTGASVLARSE